MRSKGFMFIGIKKEFIVLLVLSLSILGCSENLHLTAADNVLGVQLGFPATISPGQSLGLTDATCFPDGSSNVVIDSLPSGDFTPAPLSCDCAGGSVVNCLDGLSNPVSLITFAGNGPNGANPNIVATITDPENGDVATSNPALTIPPVVGLTGPTTVTVNTTPGLLAIVGSCGYAGSAPSAAVEITDSTGSMSPSSITCLCNGPGSSATLDCSGATPVTFSSTDLNLVSIIDDGLNTAASSTLIVNVDPVVDLTSPSGAPFNVGDNIPLIGTCLSDGDTVSIPNPSPSNLSPTGPLNCPCGSGVSGEFNCGSYELISFGISPVFTATITDSNGDIQTDSEAISTVGPGLAVTLNLSRINGALVSPGTDTYAENVLEYSVVVSNTGNGGATNVQLSDLCPTNTTANGTFSAGTGTYLAGVWTVPSLAGSGGSDTLTFECVVDSGISTGSVDNQITSVSSDQTGSVGLTEVNTTNPILGPSLDLSVGVTAPVVAGILTTLPSNMGTCAPNGAIIALSDSTGSMNSNPVACTCSGGVINCSANAVTFKSEDASLLATINAGGVGPVADSNSGNDPDVVMTPIITITDPGAGPYGASSNIVMSGTCESAGDSVTITASPATSLTAVSVSCLCSGSPGTYSCPSFTTNSSGANATVTFTATITDQDTVAPQETATSSMSEEIEFVSPPTAIVSTQTPNSDPTLACMDIPEGVNNLSSVYDASCTTPADKEVRYRVFLTPNNGSQVLIATYPSTSAFSVESDAFTASGASGTYGSVVVSDWQSFIGSTLNYGDEICVSSILRDCAAAGSLVSAESPQSCFKWFGKETHTFTGLAGTTTAPSSPSPSEFYAKVWGAGGGGGSQGEARAGSGGTGGFVQYRGNFTSNLTVVVGEGGKGNASTNSGGAASFGGGGRGGNSSGASATGAGSGGGLSGLFSGSFTHANSVVVAGGGGGSGSHTGSSFTGNGGNGGGLVGGNGTYSIAATGLQSGLQLGGTGGSQSSGGLNFSGGTSGAELTGGQGGDAGTGQSNQGGGGAGGGYFGGGGGKQKTAAGGGTADDSAGGGGSGFLLDGGVDVCSSYGAVPQSPINYETFMAPSGGPFYNPEGSADTDYDGLAGNAGHHANGGNGLIIIFWKP